MTAPAEIRRLMTGYDEATNTMNTDHGGYHHTIPLASMRAAADDLELMGPAPLHGTALLYR